MISEISFFSSTLPVKGRCEPLRTDFNQSLKNSILYLIEACKDALDPPLFEQTNNKLNSLNCNLKFSGLLGAVHLKLYNEVRSKNLLGVIEVCKELLKRDFYSYSINYINLSHESNFYKNIIEEICSSEVVRENEYYLLANKTFESSKKFMQEGFKFLKTHFNDFYTESKELISEILLLNAKGIQAGTSIDLFGMIHKNYLYRFDKLTDIIDSIIHEQSHLYLHLLNKKDVLVENPMEKYESPLRVDPRPIIGIYHAVFVLSRVIYVLSNSYERNLLPSSEMKYCKELIEYCKDRFLAGINILEKHAKMTLLGKEIIDSSKNLVKSIN